MLSKSVPGSALQKLWTKIRRLIRASWMGRIGDRVTTSPLCNSLLHDANTSWPFRRHAFTLLQPYIHKLGRSGVFLILAPSPLQLRSSIQRAEPPFSVTLLSMSGITESNAGIHATQQPGDQEKQLTDDEVLCLY